MKNRIFFIARFVNKPLKTASFDNSPDSGAIDQQRLTIQFITSVLFHQVTISSVNNQQPYRSDRAGRHLQRSCFAAQKHTQMHHVAADKSRTQQTSSVAQQHRFHS